MRLLVLLLATVCEAVESSDCCQQRAPHCATSRSSSNLKSESNLKAGSKTAHNKRRDRAAYALLANESNDAGHSAHCQNSSRVRVEQCAPIGVCGFFTEQFCLLLRIAPIARINFGAQSVRTTWAAFQPPPTARCPLQRHFTFSNFVRFWETFRDFVMQKLFARDRSPFKMPLASKRERSVWSDKKPLDYLPLLSF